MAPAAHLRGYLLDLDDAGRWQLVRSARDPYARHAVGRGRTARPVRAAPRGDARAGASVTALIDGATVASVGGQPRAYARGIGGIEAGAATAGGAFTGAEWPVVQYRGFSILR